MAFAVTGVLAAVAADLLHRALAWRGSVEVWRALEPWAPTIIPAHAGYTVAPWPLMIWLTLLVTLGFALAAVSVFVLRIRPSQRRWVRALVLWGGLVIVAVGVVGVAQLGQWLLWTETFGGAGGSFVRTFTLPALMEAARWGLLWGWIPAVATALIGIPSPRGRARGLLVRGGGLVVAAAVAATCLAVVTREAARSATTEVAQREQTEPAASPVPTDPPSEVASSAAPDFPGRCSPDDVVVTIAGSDAATGTRYLAFEARNVSTEACDLNGLPDLAFASEDGNAIRPLIEPREHSPAGEPIGGDAVTLEPGRTARADLVWRAPTGRPSEITVLMAPWPGADRTAATKTLDIVDDGEMTLTPWYVRE
ncbi:hypothetical protein GCM10010921_04840 [Microbacterium album]|uniref:DUF4232 domain-containing protein n=1 Tax=Microbacterium album TaxID=2053191 RepID=A0A917ID07_9MICO|nr:hypothetical protein GCM10010921_04840 [Microbacterium album]